MVFLTLLVHEKDGDSSNNSLQMLRPGLERSTQHHTPSNSTSSKPYALPVPYHTLCIPLLQLLRSAGANKKTTLLEENDEEDEGCILEWFGLEMPPKARPGTNAELMRRFFLVLILCF